MRRIIFLNYHPNCLKISSSSLCVHFNVFSSPFRQIPISTGKSNYHCISHAMWWIFRTHGLSNLNAFANFTPEIQRPRNWSKIWEINRENGYGRAVGFRKQLDRILERGEGYRRSQSFSTAVQSPSISMWRGFQSHSKNHSRFKILTFSQSKCDLFCCACRVIHRCRIASVPFDDD